MNELNELFVLMRTYTVYNDVINLLKNIQAEANKVY